jgi:tyrosinase
MKPVSLFLLPLCCGLMAAATAAPLTVRKNILRLTATEKQNYVAAVRQMKILPSQWNLPGESLNAYDYLVRIHKLGFDSHLDGGSGVHGAPSLMPWHREFLRAYETELKRAAISLGLTAPIAVPYWDWNDSQCTTMAFQTDLFGGNGGGANSAYTSGLVPTRSTPYRVADGGFGTKDDRTTGFPISMNPDINPGSRIAGQNQPPRPFLQRAFASDPEFGGGSSAGGTAPPLRPTSAMMAYLPTTEETSHLLSLTHYDMAPWDHKVEESVPWMQRTSLRNLAEGYAGVYEANGEPFGNMYHGRVHLWMSGHMLAPSSPNDPIFFSHHANLDRVWAQWQDLRGITHFPSQWYYQDAEGNLPNVSATDNLYGFTVEEGYVDNINCLETLDLRASGVIYDDMDFIPVVSVVSLSPSQAVLKFKSIRGRSYRAETSTSLGSWQSASPLMVATGEEMTLQATMPTGTAKAFVHIYVTYTL